MTLDGEPNDENPLLPLCEKQKQLLTKSLGVILAACAIAFLITDGLVYIRALQWVGLIDVAVLIYYKVSYRMSAKKFDPAIETPSSAYVKAKTRQYNALVAVINANSVVAVLCPAVWIILVAFVLWLVLFLSLPKNTELQKDYGCYD
ncbi:MAG: hypothetical protein K6F33_11540 [Bacteroidales bacterium]|nr:hypothetical protein [Bacteroidales bacterium]